MIKEKIRMVLGFMFEIDPAKVEDFFKNTDKSACQRAIERARKHKPITTVGDKYNEQKDDVMSGEDTYE